MRLQEAVSAMYELSSAHEFFAIPEVGKNNNVLGLRTSDGKNYIVKTYISPIYASIKSIQYEIEALRHLKENALDFAIPMPILNRYGETVSRFAHHYFCIVPKFEGTLADISQKNHLRSMGKALGQLQSGLQRLGLSQREVNSPFIQFFDYPKASCNPFALDSATLGLATANTELEALLEWWNEEATIQNDYLKTSFQDLPQQICHNDFTQNNVLVLNQSVSAVLDFEFMCLCPRVFDLAMALRTTMSVWQTPEPWDTLEIFMAAYQAYIRLSEAEINALPMLMRLRASMAILWWLGRNQGLERIPMLISFLRDFVGWLRNYESEFLSVLYKMALN